MENSDLSNDVPSDQLKSLNIGPGKCSNGNGDVKIINNVSKSIDVEQSSTNPADSLDKTDGKQINGSSQPYQDQEGFPVDEDDAAGLGKVGSSRAESRPNFGISHSHKDSFYYNMDSKTRGICLIFNHMYFDPALGMNTRKGTNADRDAIHGLFSQLGFTVIVCNDLTYDKLKQQIEYYSMEFDHKDHDCFVVFFLSHGEEGTFYCKDRNFSQDIVFKSFEANKCPSLAGKPKLFFIQACRGTQLEDGVAMMDQTDGISYSHKLPITADVMTMWSTVPGYYSWRNTTNGSWFIQSLVHVVQKYGRHFDLAGLHVAINRHMIYNFESNTPGDISMHRKKQACSMVSTATRLMHFYPPLAGKRA